VSNPPPAWHPDPHNPAQWRWWDGRQWTERTAPMEQPATTVPDPSARQSKLGALRGRLQSRGPSLSAQKPAGAPGSRGVAPWSEDLKTQAIVGESFHMESFRALAAEDGHGSIPEWGVELVDPVAAIVPDPENPYDSSAVAVWINGRHLVGHLPRTVAGIYFERLSTLDPGTHLEVPARVWIGHHEEWNDDGESRKIPTGSVTVRIPDVAGITPFNDLPDEPHVLLPWGKVAQVSGEENHMDVLRTFVLGSDPRNVAATLHVSDEPRKTGAPVRQVEVRHDGQRVGVMSKAISDQIADLVVYVDGLGRLPVARAILKGSDLRAEVTVRVARTADVPQRWLDSVRPQPGT